MEGKERGPCVCVRMYTLYVGTSLTCLSVSWVGMTEINATIVLAHENEDLQWLAIG